ncbi:RNA-binding protein 42 [Podila verticillata]|nr:RNA-binding protein 42 [Podila verticillata]
MAYNGAPQQQLTQEEIAYWASLGYYYDPAYAPAPAPTYDYPSQPYGASGQSIPSRGYQGGNRQGYEYEDLNKIFVDPKKAKEEADAAAAKAEADAKTAKDKAAATVVRSAAGQTWQDSTLLEFEENDFRLFAGDLGNEITDDLLSKTFSKYPSFLKAKVVRDKKTQKSKGYGFISFADAEDFARAWKEMDGKYVGNRPIKLRKSQWKDRNVEIIREPKTTRGPYDPEAITRKERAKPYKVKKLNNAGK